MIHLDITEVINIAIQEGMTLWVDDGVLRWKSLQPPKPEVLGLLKKHKQEILEYFKTITTWCNEAMYMLNECDCIEQDLQQQKIFPLWIATHQWFAMCHQRLSWASQLFEVICTHLVQTEKIVFSHCRQNVRINWLRAVF